ESGVSGGGGRGSAEEKLDAHVDGSVIRTPLMPTASAIFAKSGLSKSVPVGRKPVDFCSSSMKPKAPLLNTTTFTGSASCFSDSRSPISMVKPPSPRERYHLAAGCPGLGAHRLRHPVG